jgi:hypothetical protein
MRSGDCRILVSGIYAMLGFFAVCLSPSAYSQSDYKAVNSLTYRLYREQKWDSLQPVCRHAIRSGLDYYYLRMRYGIAEYNCRKYVSASEQFYQALCFNSIDTAGREYLYFSYLFANRTDDARALSGTMSDSQKASLKTGNPVLGHVSAEAGMAFSSENAIKTTPPDLMKTDSIYGEQDVYRNWSFASLALTFNLAPCANLTLAYNYLRFSKIRYFQYNTVTSRLDSTVNTDWGYRNYYSFPDSITSSQYTYSINQHEIFLGSTIVIPERIRIEPFFHLIRVGYPLAGMRVSATDVTDTSYAVISDSARSYSTFPFTQYKYILNVKDTLFYNYVAGLSISKDFDLYSLGLSFSWSNLNGMDQTQAGWSFSYFPLGTNNLYGNTSLTGFFQGSDARFILSQVAGLKVLKKTWLEGSFIWGDLTNANIGNGTLVYNNSDKIDYRLGLNLYYFFSRHLEAWLSWQFFRKESPVYYYTWTEPGNTNSLTRKTEYQPYHTNSIFGGIKWNL